MLDRESERVKRIVERAEIYPAVGHGHACEVRERSDRIAARIKFLAGGGIESVKNRMTRQLRALLRTEQSALVLVRLAHVLAARKRKHHAVGDHRRGGDH